MTHKRSRSRIRTLVAIVLLAVMLFPVYWMLNISLQSSGSALVTTLFPTHPSLSGYHAAIRDQGGNLVTSLLIAGGTVVLTLLIATPCAYALAQFRFRWVSWALLGILLSQMIPGIVVANALYSVYEQLGLLNSIPGLIVANTASAVPFGILITRSYMMGIPSEIVEAAYVDGAGPLRAFVSVVLPVSRNAVITVGLFAFLFAWSDFIFALTLTTKSSVRPITLGIYSYLGDHVENWNSVMATAMLASIPAILLLVVAQRYIAAGASSGAVK
jgi:multiple sugar transport system permease protein